MYTHARRRLDRQNRRLIATFVVFSLMGAPCVMADGSVGETLVSSAQLGQNIGPLLLKLEQQIEAEHVALPKSDNATETWLLVIAKAYPTTPETRLALANFAAHALDRATTERAAGKEVAATEFQVFADLASDLLNKDGALITSSESPSASYSTETPQVSSRSASPATGSTSLRTPQSIDTASPPQAPQPNRANEPPPLSGPAVAGISSSANASSANPTRPPAPTSQAALTADPGPLLKTSSKSPSASHSVGTPQVSSRSAYATTSSTGLRDPQSVDTTSPPQAAQPSRTNEPSPLSGPAIPGITSSANASSANATRPPAPTSQAMLTVAPGPSASAAVLNSASANPDGGNTKHSTAHMGQMPLAPLPSTNRITPLPTIQDQSLAAMYATRGDQMLAVKDVSAARRLYEYAANAGSARAATALARTFDPSFLIRLGVVGLKPDPALAAVWYGKAVALGDRDADTLLRNLNAEAAK
jgi:hypothetical protein